jgi:hypothetical protein
MGPGIPGIGFQNMVSAASAVGELIVADILGAADTGCEYGYVDNGKLV